MRLGIIGGLLLVVGTVGAVVFDVPAERLLELADRVVPVLVFVVGITIVAELASEAGVFDWLANLTARWGRGRTLAVWLLTAALTTVVAVFLSLDTAAVLLTPVVVLMAQKAGLPPIPFALTTVWLANTASLLLPVSNLTNLLAHDTLGAPSVPEFVTMTALPWLAAVIVPLLVLLVRYRSRLFGRYLIPAAHTVRTDARFRVSAITVAVLVPLLASGVPVWIPSTIAAAVLVVLFALRDRDALTWRLVPWSLLLFASGLFLVVEVVETLGSTEIVRALAGTGDGPLDLLRMAGLGALSGNLIDNLPAYLVLEPAADSPARLIALLVGVNAGVLITPWASLATLLWHGRLTSLGEDISWPRFAGLGLIVVPLTVTAATLAILI